MIRGGPRLKAGTDKKAVKGSNAREVDVERRSLDRRPTQFQLRDIAPTGSIDRANFDRGVAHGRQDALAAKLLRRKRARGEARTVSDYPFRSEVNGYSATQLAPPLPCKPAAGRGGVLAAAGFVNRVAARPGRSSDA